MNKATDSGFRAIIDQMSQEQAAPPKPSNTFIFDGYRRKGFGFVAIFRQNGVEISHDEFTCGQIAQNAPEGSELKAATKQAVQQWPNAR